MNFPPHKCSLHLTHNEHKSYYHTLAQEIDQRPDWYGEGDWVSEEQRLKAIETDECWSLQWYPDTPVGFCVLHAADLDALLEEAMHNPETQKDAPPACDRRGV